MKISPSKKLLPGAVVVGVVLLGGAALMVKARMADAGPPTYRLVTGQDLTYSVTYSNNARADFSALLPNDKSGASPPPTTSNLMQAVQSSVTGKWVMVVVAQDEKGYVLACHLEDACVSLTAGGQDSQEQAEVVRRELEKPLFVRVSPQGKVLNVRFDDSTQSTSQNFARALVSSAQFVVPDAAKAKAATWETTEDDTLGKYAALYETAPESKGDKKDASESKEDKGYSVGSLFRKTKVRYFPASAGTAKEAPMAQTIEPDTNILARFDVRNGYLVSLRGSEKQSVTLAGQDVAQSESNIAFKLEEQGSLAAKELEALQGQNTENEKLVKAVGLYVAPSVEEVREASRKRTLGEETMGTLLSELAKHQKAGETENAELYLKFRALADLHPESCPFLGKLLAMVPASSLSFRIVGEALAAVDSTEAQDALLFAIKTRPNDEDALLRLIPFLGMENNPSPAVQQAMTELSVSSGNRLVASTAQLALGGMARSLIKSSPTRSAQIVDKIVVQLQNAKSPAEIQQLLLTLGNTGSTRALASLQIFSQSKTIPLRATAINSLRFIESPTAENLLLTTLAQDGEADVRLEAARALGFRPMSDVSFQLQRTALDKEKNANVRLAVLNNLYVSRKRLNELKQIVEDLIQHDPSLDVRQAASRIKTQSPEIFGKAKETV
ncbi:hypothetical protein EON83_03865 [bacterium]|nr:MAG: hypothetical protein EON83_03865 [bacterium]